MGCQRVSLILIFEFLESDPLSNYQNLIRFICCKGQQNTLTVATFSMNCIIQVHLTTTSMSSHASEPVHIYRWRHHPLHG